MQQHTRPELNDLTYANLPNNTAGAIDPGKLREVVLALIASFVNLLEEGNPGAGGGAAVPQPAQATFGNLGGAAQDNASLVNYVAALGHALTEYLPPMAVQQGRWYVAGNGIWEAKSSFNGAAAPSVNAYWRLVVDFGDALKATAAGKALLTAPTALAQRQLLDIFTTAAGQYGTGQPAFTTAYQADGALVYLLKQVDYLFTQLQAAASPAKPAAPTAGQVDDTADTFSFLPNPAYPSFSQYKVNGLPGVTGAVVLDATNSYVSGSRVYIKVVGPVAKGGLAVYVGGSGSVPDGAVLTNADPFTGTGVVTPPIPAALTAALAISVASMTLGSAVAFSITPTGGTAPYGYAVVATDVATGQQITLGAAKAGTWTPTAVGSYAIDATVTDSNSPAQMAQTATRYLQVVAAANRIPVADAGQDLTIQLPTSAAALMGTASDPDQGDTLTYAWRQITGPNLAAGLPATTLNVVVSNLVAGTYQFGFRSTDQNGGQSVEDYVLLTVQAATGGGSQTFLQQLALSVTAAREASLYPAAAASDYSYSFLPLPLPSAVVIAPPAGAIKLSSGSGVIGDADNSEGSTNYGTDTTAAIQQFFDNGSAAATENDPFNVHWDIPTGISAVIRVRSNTHIYFGLNCGPIVRPGANCGAFETYSWYSKTTRDRNIGFYGPGLINANSFSGNTLPTSDSGYNQIHSSPSTGWTTAVRVGHCDNFTWDGPAIVRQRTFAIHACFTTGLVLKNGIINAGTPGAPLYTDGLHVNYTNTNVTIDNWQISSHDDKISIAVNDAMDSQTTGGPSTYYSTMTQGQTLLMDGVTVTGIEFTGGVFGLRVYSGADPLRNVSFKGIYGSTRGYWLIMDNYWQSKGYDRQGPGFINNVSFEDVYVQCSNSGEGYINECAANINCNAQNITFRNINRTGFSQSNFPSLLISGANTVVSNLTWDGYQAHDLDGNSFQNSHIVIREAQVTGLTISGARVSRLGAPSGNALVELVSGALAGLAISDTQVDGLANVVKHSGGTLGTVSATSVYHVNAGTGNGSFYSLLTPGPKVTATNCTTQLLTQGTFTS